jgi:translation initiation factor IF-3
VSSEFLTNRAIKAGRILLIDHEGNKRGEFFRDDAIKLAEESSLDLVAVGGSSALPVCKIMDYGKYQYAQKKRAKQNVSHAVKVKEIKIGFLADQDYVDLKTRQARKFLEEGNRVKLSIKFKGRESAHINLIREKCMGICNTLSDVADTDTNPRQYGRQMTVLLMPKKQL